MAEVDQPQDLAERHQQAEAKIATYKFMRPDSAQIKSKAITRLAKGELVRGLVQVLKKDAGENNLHYHTNAETFWWVIKGRVHFYGPDDVLLGEFGPGEGIITPRYSRYWFANGGDDDLELLQVAASDSFGHPSGRTDVSERRESFASALRIDAG